MCSLGVAILYNEENFSVEDAGIEVPGGIEAVWAILTPKVRDADTSGWSLYCTSFSVQARIHRPHNRVNV